MHKQVLIIAGTDPTGAAGITVDIKTLCHFNIQPSIAISAINIQNKHRVIKIQPSSVDILQQQIICAIEACDIKIVKIGMIYSAQNAYMISNLLQKYQLTAIFDPVLKASSGYALGEKKLKEAIIKYMLPSISLLTPNLSELAILCNDEVAPNSIKAIKQAQYLINKFNASAILIKGGHSIETNDATDVLCRKNTEPLYFTSPMIGKQKRGTGCALSSAIAANLAKNYDIINSIKQAKQYISRYIAE